MDPISQGALGAVAALSISKSPHARIAAFAGAVGGMLADADILIKSASDPLLNIEYHRHFSHSLLFIPVGGLIAALLLFYFFRKKIKPAELYLYCTSGYATAGLLDACTSYGTQLLWPFSDLRVSWSIISIIDPIFTLPIVILICIAVFRKKPQFGQAALAFAICYLSLGFIQHTRAKAQLDLIIESRGHDSATRRTVKPSIANLIVWRSVYLHDNTYYVDAIRVAKLGKPQIYEGAHLPAYDLESALANHPEDSPLASDLTRFNHFSEGYLAALPDEPNFITDLRYSAIPNSINPLWGLNLNEINQAGHAAFENRRALSEEDRESFARMFKGEESPATQPHP
ncbi:metal-dependent hydrolase [Pelagicoccus mobilis]|uniref:Metal-dependent hydrolase n=1 Tax=Pelagicoccus mobilis TaxID=415221 RepID=A0A934VTR9_9BACT|nr:metal-dependent hydrolase [Pelagicoccus mobilis]MBK1880013.1 metal-dependent hydrolase [Pelagicoccus mobilis]